MSEISSNIQKVDPSRQSSNTTATGDSASTSSSSNLATRLDSAKRTTASMRSESGAPNSSTNRTNNSSNESEEAKKPEGANETENQNNINDGSEYSDPLKDKAKEHMKNADSYATKAKSAESRASAIGGNIAKINNQLKAQMGYYSQLQKLSAGSQGAGAKLAYRDSMAPVKARIDALKQQIKELQQEQKEHQQQAQALRTQEDLERSVAKMYNGSADSIDSAYGNINSQVA